MQAEETINYNEFEGVVDLTAFRILRVKMTPEEYAEVVEKAIEHCASHNCMTPEQCINAAYKKSIS